MKKLYVSVLLSSLVAMPVLATNSIDDQHRYHSVAQNEKEHAKQQSHTDKMEEHMKMMDSMNMNMEDAPEECKKMMSS
ncbi:hypothetical protein [Vibrio alginolyticus]|uniref:hypothetical protein n=1 Tax=Vibrio alginolyticus TaxID=663 RepID=UPI0005ACC1C1|nr:hypothetical protein [Vibrio alginolyticus]EJL6789622.1 hypothetical protein [Vibrio alginolyticus]KIP74338.1 hypothetical protein SN12_05145 [Vibrio alginolyticus]KIP84165.1 hypothetical protein SN13_06680 [Vibrio alginolyticus]MCR9391143.1 hypothetical protein [Vibrio alginolyticus]MCY9818124.1 hypothetical protein [Vibrio alginolyticus]